MPKQIIESKNAPAPIGPYNQAVLANGTLYISGQIPLDAATGELITGDIVAHTKKVMENLSEILSAANMNFTNVVKTTIFLSDMSLFTSVNEVYGKRFEKNPPARSTVAVAGLPKGVNVEIEVLAHKGAV